jgi:hypothetical protein
VVLKSSADASQLLFALLHGLVRLLLVVPFLVE